MAKEIIVAKHAGFCFGVRQAVDLAFGVAEVNQNQGKPIYSYGPLIHNQSVTDRLANLGVTMVNELSSLKDKDVIIRSHGAEKLVYDIAQKNQLNLIDTTCKFVRRVHDIVKKHDQNGDHILIAGDVAHPEVKAIMSWANRVTVIADGDEINRISNIDKPICLVAQTTLNLKLWDDIKQLVYQKFDNVVHYDTICQATEIRQNEAREIAQKVDFMFVIGGKNSSNTQKLYEISLEVCKNAKLIQDFSQIKVKNLEKYDRIGIVAGASTPDWIIEDIIQKLKNEKAR